MVLDQLTHHTLYHSLHARFATAFDFLLQPNLDQLETGTHMLEEEKLTAIVAREQGRTVSAGKLEAHQRFIDIQYLISGNESIGWAPAQNLTPIVPYDATRDLIFFNEPPQTTLQLRPADFTIFWPGDAHLPLVGTGSIHKIILKVLIEP